MTNDEAATLLPNAPRTDERQHTRRSQTLRVAVGVVSALALVAGSVVAVDLLSQQQQQLQQHVAPMALDAQFGWGTWCTARATVGCLFSSDRETCKQEVMAKCDPGEATSEHSGGDGSGSGSGSGSGWGAGSHHGSPNVGDPEHHNKTHHGHNGNHGHHGHKGNHSTTAVPTHAPEATTHAPQAEHTTAPPA